MIRLQGRLSLPAWAWVWRRSCEKIKEHLEVKGNKLWFPGSVWLQLCSLPKWAIQVSGRRWRCSTWRQLYKKTRTDALAFITFLKREMGWLKRQRMWSYWDNNCWKPGESVSEFVRHNAPHHGCRAQMPPQALQDMAVTLLKIKLSFSYIMGHLRTFSCKCQALYVGFSAWKAPAHLLGYGSSPYIMADLRYMWLWSCEFSCAWNKIDQRDKFRTKANVQRSLRQDTGWIASAASSLDLHLKVLVIILNQII